MKILITMKKSIFITIVLSIIQSTITYGQCIADAGPDTFVCVGMSGMDSAQIGGNPSALGGTPPYTYTWEAKYVISFGNYTWTYTASDFLNDTTLPNPSVVEHYSDLIDTVAFSLKVQDAIGLICKDTVIVYYSILMYNCSVFIFDIQQGDSIYLNYGVNAWSSFPTNEYLWRPNHGLNDSISLSFWAKPDYTTNYYVTITDSVGCVFQAPDYYNIHVIPVSTTEIEKKEHSIFGFPNPANESIQLTIKKQNKSENHNLVIFDISGRQVAELEVASGTTTVQIDVSEWKSGLYTAITSCNGKINGKGKFTVR